MPTKIPDSNPTLVEVTIELGQEDDMLECRW